MLNEILLLRNREQFCLHLIIILHDDADVIFLILKPTNDKQNLSKLENLNYYFKTHC